MKIKTLDLLKPGCTAVIKEIKNDASIKRRLFDMGFIKNSIIECVMSSPLKDPNAYLIRGTLIAIRNNDAKLIEIDDVI